MGESLRMSLSLLLASRVPPMAEAVADPRRRVAQEGLITRSLTATAKVIQWLLLSLLFSIIVEWVGMVLWWPDEGTGSQPPPCLPRRSVISVPTSSEASSHPTRHGLPNGLPTTPTTTCSEVTRFTGPSSDWVSPATRATNERGLRSTLHKIYYPIAEFVIAMMQVTQVFSVRLAILTLAMPVFLLFSLVALVDGLVQRDLRRWGGGQGELVRLPLCEESQRYP